MNEIDLSFWLGGEFVKASLFLAIVWLGWLLMRKRSAAAQHRWWILGFAGCLLVPIVSFVAPAWTVPQSPQWMQTNRIQTPENRLPVELPVSGEHGDGVAGAISSNNHPEVFSQPAELSFTQAHIPAAEKGGIKTELSSVEAANSNIAVSGAAKFDLRQVFEFPWAKTLIAVWIFGVVIVYSRNIWQQLLLSRMLRCCSKLDDPDWQVLLRESAELLGIGTKVDLLEHDAALSPVTAGVWRPVLILPVDARSWSRNRRQLVLLHELAHVSRRDVLSQMLAGLGCGLYWFNPLFWYGLLQMRKLRELACDDLVLSCGQQPAGYADVLLDIARSYRHRTYASAVGMAHNNNVESRIMAILDKTRRHVTLSRTSARMLFAFAAALLCLVATAQLRTQAEPPAPVQQEEKQSTKPTKVASEDTGDEPDEDTRMMKIRILDDNGKPLVGAKMQANFFYPDNTPGPKDHTADDNGTILLRLPNRLDLLRLWPSQPGYVGEFKNFQKGPLHEGELIPDAFEFRLSKGHTIGGRIVDAEGNPIQDVEVRTMVEDGPPMISIWLPHAKTDSKGYWQIGAAPGPPDEGADCKFSLKLTHEDYISDEHWGDAQREQGVQTSDLRRGDAEIVLQQGTAVTGAVTDSEGKPVTKGWVVFRDDPYFSQGVGEAELQPDGRYRTPPLPDGEHPITIVAPGFAAQRRIVKVGSDSSEQPFKLRPGKRITIRFVDSSGNPVPKTGVTLATSSIPDTWQNSNALHNHSKCSNVPDYGIPRYADEQGVFVWDWAPEEPVKYGVGVRGFAGQNISLVPKKEAHIVTLSRMRVVSGKVTDSATGKPIKSFSVMPVIAFRPNFLFTRYENAVKGSDGQYTLPLAGSAEPSSRYHVRIEADGYRSIISEVSFGPMDGRVALDDVELDPAPMRPGRVIDADGNPVANATILQGTPSCVPRTENGKPDRVSRTVEPDNEGRFEIKPTTEPVRVRVLHDTGIAEKLIQPDETSIGELQLQPWAKISGRLMQNGQPVGNQPVYFYALVDRKQDDPRFQDSYYALTTADGTFTFDRLPPGAGRLGPFLGPWRDSPLTSAKNLPLKLEPGASHNVVLGGDGAVITGQVVATGRDEVPLDRKYSLNYLISRDRGVASVEANLPNMSFDPSSYGPSNPMQLSWSLDPNFHKWLATRENHFVKLNSDGDLRVTGVDPGSYDLVIRLYEQPAGCLVETVGEKIVAVEVKDDGDIKLGRIEVPCRAGPRPGSDMRAYSFVDSTGQKQSINDMAGRYVLMHVWASWCQPCFETMPQIKDFIESESAKSQSVTVVGLNIDKDSSTARGLAKERGWDWSQNYLGNKSDMARQLAISSVPTYYLIGPDGKLVTSANQWSDIKKKLAESAKEPAKE